MPTAVCRELPTLLRSGALGSAPDRALLDLYRERRDGDAFAALVRRHGPMVWGVCRRALGDHHAAEDAFQETFLVLARRAGAVRPGEAVAPWLYGVAVRLARKRRASAARRSAREAALEAEPAGGPSAPALLQAREHAALVDGELAALPGPLRAAVVLCDLEGLTRREASEQLNCPEGTVASRLARGRGRLADRLRRRGLDSADAAPVVVPAGLPVPAALQAAALRAALRLPAPGLGSAGLLGWVGSRLAWSRPIPAAPATTLGAALALVPMGLVGSAPPPDTPSTPPPAAPAPAPLPVTTPAPAGPERRPAADPSLRAEVAATLDRASRLLLGTPALREEIPMLTAIAKWQGGAGLLQDRDATIDRLVAEAPKFSYDARHNTIQDLAEWGRIEDALKLVRANYIRDTIDDTLSPLHEFDQAHVEMACGLALAGDMTWARRFAGMVPPGSGFENQFDHVLVEAKVRQKDWAGAKEEARKQKPGNRENWLMKIAERQVRDGDAGAADSVREFRRWADTLPAEPPDPRKDRRSPKQPYRPQLAGLLASIGEVDAALRIVGDLESPGDRDHAWRAIAQAHLERGRVADARVAIAKVQPGEDRTAFQVGIVRALVKSGDLDAARRECDAISDDVVKAHTLALLGRGQAERGRVAEAAATLAEARQRASTIVDSPRWTGFKFIAYHRIGQAQAAIPDRSGDGWIDALDDPKDRLAALLGLADGLIRRITGGFSPIHTDDMD